MAAEAKLLGLAHIGIYTKNIEKSIQFYTAMGFATDAKINNGGTNLAFLSLGTCLLELINPADASRVDEKGDGIVAHVAIECRNIDALLKDFKAKGLVPADCAWRELPNLLDGVRNVFFKGPSGEDIELFDYYNRY